MAKKGFLSDVFSKELLWAGAGGAAAWGGYYLVGKVLPNAVSDADQTKATLKQVAISSVVGFGGAYVASEVANAPKGFAAGMAGMAGTLAAVAAVLFIKSRSGDGAQAGVGYIPGPMPSAKPAPNYVSYGLGNAKRQLIAGTGISTMGNVAEVRVRDNPAYVPSMPRGADALRQWW